MSKNRRHRSHADAPSAPITAQPAPPPPEPTQEKSMEVNQEASPAAVEAQTGPSAKEQAMAEERNAALALQNTARVQEEPLPERNILGVAARGRDHLLEQMRQLHEERAKKAPYEPPPRTERQLSALQEELEAGRRAQARAEAQQAHRPQPKPDVNEGFTTPVYRPGSAVPDPMVPSATGFVAGSKEFGPDA